MMHLLIVGIVALAVLIIGFVVGMCITAKRADEAIVRSNPAPAALSVRRSLDEYVDEQIKSKEKL